MSTRVIEKPNPWDRQPGESQTAFAAFTTWLHLPVRSIIEAYRQHSGQLSARSRPGWFGKWVVRHRWAERAHAYDQEITRQAQQREIEAVIAEREKWRERRAQVAEDEWLYAQELITKAKEMLNFPVAEQKMTDTQRLDNGTVIQHITIKPGPWRARDAGYMLGLATKMRRLAADMATDRIETVDPLSQAEKRLVEARKALADARLMDHGLDDAIVVEKIATAFGYTVDELLEPSADEMTTGQLMM